MFLFFRTKTIVYENKPHVTYGCDGLPTRTRKLKSIIYDDDSYGRDFETIMAVGSQPFSWWQQNIPLWKNLVNASHWLKILSQYDTTTGHFCEDRILQVLSLSHNIPHNKVHGANMGPIWVLPAPDGPHIGPMNLAIRDASYYSTFIIMSYLQLFHSSLLLILHVVKDSNYSHHFNLSI